MASGLRCMCVGVVFVIAGLVLAPSAVRAQGSASIAGVVRDGSGAVLPGVTVEVSSPALIEKVRAGVTDTSGRYNIVDLRPGVYAVTFTLPGFRPVRREGIALTTGFTATVTAELEVGGLEETITVTGESPIVDTRNVRSQSVLSREYLDTIPTGKNTAGFAALTLGVTASAGADVGGSKGEMSSTLTVHGSRPGDQKVMVDGMSYNYLGAGGTLRLFFINQLSMQEMVFETGGMNAESATVGVQQNAIPKDGGNTYSVSAMANYTNTNLLTDNLTDELRARGLTVTSTPKKIYDTALGLGGPIKQDALWFYGAARWAGADEYGPNLYFNKTPNTLFYTPDLSRRAYRENKNRNQSVRLTWQASQKQKLTGLYINSWNCFCYFNNFNTALETNRAPEAGQYLYYPSSMTQVTWTNPATNQLLFQVGASYVRNGLDIEPVDGVTPDDIQVTELSTGFVYGAKGGGLGAINYGSRMYPAILVRASGSYVTGSHSVKIGADFHQSINARDSHYVNHAMDYAFRRPTADAAPVPVSVTQWASPTDIRSAGRDIGLYAQDQWTIRRLTLNLGVRFDNLKIWVPAQTRPAGRFVAEFPIERVNNVPNWKDVTPRLGVAYDLFGTGRTAIKASLGRYVAAFTDPSSNPYHPGNYIVQSATRVWNDANGNYVPEESELGPLSNSAFGTLVQNTRFADEIVRGWGTRQDTWQASAAVQHELRPSLGLLFGYYRTSHGNFQTTDNQRVTPADYSPYCVTAPTDPRLPGGGGNQLCGFFDISPGAFGAVDNLVTHASKFGKQTDIYNGVDLALGARFGQGGMLNGGVSYGQTTTNACFVVDSPQQLYHCDVTNPSTQVKFNGVYPLPWDVAVSWTYQNLQGTPILATRTYTNAQIASSLGRNLGQCGTRVPCNGTASVSLIEPGTMFEDRYTQLDLRLTKSIRLGGVRLQAMADVYNMFSASAITSRNNSYGPTWGRPTGVQIGRLFKFGTQIDW